MSGLALRKLLTLWNNPLLAPRDNEVHLSLVDRKSLRFVELMSVRAYLISRLMDHLERVAISDRLDVFEGGVGIARQRRSY